MVSSFIIKGDNMKKEIVTQEDLFKVLDIIEKTEITYWLDGGWGVDVLVEKQTRKHRDVDIDFDSKYTEKITSILKDNGYEIVEDWSPVRIELHHPNLGYIDIHPFIINEDGSAKQASLDGGWYEFEADVFGSAIYNGKMIPCISAMGQKKFHTGYPLREVDKHDIINIESLLNNKK